MVTMLWITVTLTQLVFGALLIPSCSVMAQDQHADIYMQDGDIHIDTWVSNGSIFVNGERMISEGELTSVKTSILQELRAFESLIQVAGFWPAVDEWTLVAKISNTDEKNWGCPNENKCSGSLWNSDDNYINPQSMWFTSEDAKYEGFNNDVGNDLLFMELETKQKLLQVNGILNGTSLQGLIRSLQVSPRQSNKCTREVPIDYIFTGRKHAFCACDDCSRGATFGIWCLDEAETFAVRDFTLFTVPNLDCFSSNYAPKPGILHDRLDIDHAWDDTQRSMDFFIGPTSHALQDVTSYTPTPEEQRTIAIFVR